MEEKRRLRSTIRRMESDNPLRAHIHKLLEDSDLTFRDFMELALYHPQFGYYSRGVNPVGKEGDYVTAPTLSPLFGDVLRRLVAEFVSRSRGEVSTVVDMGCGDGSLILSLYVEGARFFGVDRSLSRVPAASPVSFVRSLEEVPRDGQHLLIANELFDALPFVRVVQRDEHLHELWVTERNGELDWSEHEAPAPYEDYFHERGIELADGQFADVSFEWEDLYSDLAAFVSKGLIVTFDYGSAQDRLFNPRFRRFGTAATYHDQRVSRDLLRDPGRRDLTAHINFSDLIRAGERAGMRTLYFDRMAKFLLALGAFDHDALRPAETLEALQARDDARRMILPDGIGDDIRVLVQAKDSGEEPWPFQRNLFER
jgi:SAM-dependent MidA family methyltransferase